jgi:Cu-processing system permease protein
MRSNAALMPTRLLPDVHTVITLARKEVRDSLRNRWFVLYTLAFTVLALGLSWLSLASAPGSSGGGSAELAGFGRTAAGLINLVMLIVPLMALTAGAGSLAGERERGTLAYLLSQPVTRFEVLAGKYLGLALAMLASLAMGFGVSALVIAVRSGSAAPGSAMSYLRLVALAYALSLAMLSLGFLISAWTRKAGVATAAAVFVWLGLVFVGDLGLMGSALAFKLHVQELFHLSLINPLQVFKMASLGSMAPGSSGGVSLDVLGPAGLYAMHAYGAHLSCIFGVALAVWIVVPLAIAQTLFVRRGRGAVA